MLRWLVEHKHVSAIVTTAGGIEEDFIKCLGETYMGSFSDVGANLRKRGLNRIGNLVVPNANYCAFEDWVVPILDKMLEEQEASKGTDDEINWTPSKIIHRLGKEINDERSVYYWAYKNGIPVFCPALTDGSLGDMLYFHTFKSSPQQLKVDIVEDIRKINTISVRAKRAGMIILGGGIVKHHIANACLMRNGAESAVYINTGQEFDGSDAGARPDEAVSWGKIKIGADSVKVNGQSFYPCGDTLAHRFKGVLINPATGIYGGYSLFPIHCGQHLCQGYLNKTIYAFCDQIHIEAFLSIVHSLYWSKDSMRLHGSLDLHSLPDISSRLDNLLEATESLLPRRLTIAFSPYTNALKAL